MEQIGVVIISEKRNTRTLKVNYRTAKRLWICKKMISDCRSRCDLSIANVICDEGMLIIAHSDYSTISVLVSRENRIEVINEDNAEIYYSILDSVNENMLSDNILSKRGWDTQLDFIDGLKCDKVTEANIGIYNCKLAEEYNKRDILTGTIIDTEELKDKLVNVKDAVPTTILIILSNIAKIKKILIWDEAEVIGIIQKNGFRYTLEINSKSFNTIKDILTK